MEYAYDNKEVEDFFTSNGIEIDKDKSGVNSLFLRDILGSELNLIAESGVEQIPSIFVE